MRKSPQQHAGDYEEGVLKIGEDKHYYIVTGRIDGSKYWRKTILGHNKYKQIKSKNKIKIGELFSDVLTRNYFVTDAFLKVLHNQPMKKMWKWGNAYIYGNYAKDNWIYVGCHGNDMGTTGIALDTGDFQKISNALSEYIIKNKNYPNDNQWDNVNYLKNIKKNVSDNILFLGATYGGDVGAEIYVHLDKSRNIDGLILDNNCIINRVNFDIKRKPGTYPKLLKFK